MTRQYLIKPLLSADYPMISHGKGVYLYDTNEKQYLDGCSGAVTASIGHGVPEVIETMTKQAMKVSFVYRSQFTNQPAELLAEKLSSLAPGDINWSFFVNSGSEAIETAMKIALQYWQEKGRPQKQTFLSRWMSYHGITIGSLSLSGHVARRERFSPLLESYPSLSPPYCYRCPYSATYPSCQLRCATELEEIIEKIGAKYIAAFVAEPIVGAAGAAITPPDGYFQMIKDICDKYEILFIADEVMTGLGRTGKMFAIEHWGIVPDIIALGKGMSAGYAPIAATLVSDQVMEPILHGSQIIMSGHTYSANPQSAAAALAVLKYIEKHDLVKQAKISGDILFTKLSKLMNRFSFIGDVRGKGLLIGMEFIEDRASKKPFPRAYGLTNMIIKKGMECGLLLYPASSGRNGTNGDGILIAPPLTISKKEIDDLISRLAKTFLAVEQYIHQKRRRDGNGEQGS